MSIKKIKFGCTPSLPAVYDESLSFLEAQGVVVKAVNDCIENVNELEGIVEGVTDDVEDLKSRMQTAEGDIDALEGRIDSAESDIDVLEETMQGVQSDISSLGERMGTAEGDIDALEGRMNTAEGDIDTLEGKMESAEGDIDALEGRVGTAEDDIDALESDVDDVEEVLDDIIDELWDSDTESGNPVVLDSALKQKAISTIISMLPIQAGSGDPSPSNIRPIRGRTSVSLNGCGKNLYYYTKTSETVSGVTYTVNADKTISVSGTGNGGNNFNLPKFRLPNKGQTIVCTGISEATNISWAGIKLYDSNDTVIYTQAEYSSIDKQSIDLSSYPTAVAISLSFKRSLNGIVSGTIKPMVRNASITDDTYEPYTPNNAMPITVNFGETVYGGTLDVKSGVLTVDKGYIASYNGETINEPWISDRDVYVQGTTPTIGAEVAYPLATPTTIQLTPKEVELINGTNTVTTTGDEIQITYYTEPSAIDYLMSAVSSLGDEITRIDNEITAINERIGSTIAPSFTWSGTIAPSSNVNVGEFEFNTEEDDRQADVEICVELNVALESGASSMLVTIGLALNGVPDQYTYQTYVNDGYNVLTVNFKTSELLAGNYVGSVYISTNANGSV